MNKIVIFSGAGISAESGLKTFRDSNGLWEDYDINEVATPEAWRANPRMVLEFYNMRRKQVIKAEPNDAHLAIAKLQQLFNVQIITQNIDDLHERAGSKNVLHLHGEILKSRSTKTGKIYPLNGSELNLGDLCEENHQLRPHVVWFGEDVPKMEEAYNICEDADTLIIVGTSLNVYPAANIINFAPPHCKTFLVDPKNVLNSDLRNISVIKEKASIGIPILAKILSE